MDRMLQENQALRFEVDVTGMGLGESQDRIAALKGEVSKLSKAAAEREREERNRQQSSDRDDKQTLVLQMMVRAQLLFFLRLVTPAVESGVGLLFLIYSRVRNQCHPPFSPFLPSPRD